MLKSPHHAKATTASSHPHLSGKLRRKMCELKLKDPHDLQSCSLAVVGGRYSQITRKNETATAWALSGPHVNLWWSSPVNTKGSGIKPLVPCCLPAFASRVARQGNFFFFCCCFCCITGQFLPWVGSFVKKETDKHVGTPLPFAVVSSLDFTISKGNRGEDWIPKVGFGWKV